MIGLVRFLTRVASSVLVVALSTAVCVAAVPTDRIVLLYEKERADSPNRQDGVVLDTMRALQRQLTDKHYRILPVPAEVTVALDRGPGVIVSFASDAGLSMVYSVDRYTRPDAGVDTVVAEVVVRASVFVGASLLSIEEGRGEIRLRGTEAARRINERRAMKAAAESAAEELVLLVDERLKGLTPEEVEAYAEVGRVEDTQIFELPMPPPVPGAEPLAPPARTHVIIIGVSDYRQASQLSGRPIQDLAGVATDVDAMERTFLEMGVARENLVVLTNQRATADRIRTEFSQLAERAGPNDLIVAYISGHGLQVNRKRQGMSMPAFYDFSLKAPESSPDFEELLSLMTQSRATRHAMIIDTCHSGGAASVLDNVVVTSRGAELSRATGAPAPQLLTRQIPSGSNVAVLSSARYDEVAIDQGAGKGGLFTMYLTRGLLDGKGVDTLRDIVENRVAPEVIERSRDTRRRWAKSGSGNCATGQQTPTFGYSGAGDMIRM